jgi:hypothetical protein
MLLGKAQRNHNNLTPWSRNPNKWRNHNNPIPMNRSKITNHRNLIEL